jgi:hypothetical protein
VFLASIIIFKTLDLYSYKTQPSFWLKPRSVHMSNHGCCRVPLWSPAFHEVRVLTIAFRVVRSVRMAAVIATCSASLPLAAIGSMR